MGKTLLMPYDNTENTRYNSADFRELYGAMFSNGILVPSGENVSTSTACKVTNVNSTTVKVAAGGVFINGAYRHFDDTNITLDTDGTYKVVSEYSEAGNGITLKAIQGDLLKTSTLYQIQLAIAVKSGTTLTITDTRSDPTVCGFVNKMVSNTAQNIQGIPVAPTAPTLGQILAYDGIKYTPTPIINNYETKTIIGNATNVTASSTMAYVQRIGGINIIILSGNFIAKKSLVYGEELGTIQGFASSSPLTFVINNDTARAPVGLQIMTDGKIILRGTGVSTNHYLILTGTSMAYLS